MLYPAECSSGREFTADCGSDRTGAFHVCVKEVYGELFCAITDFVSHSVRDFFACQKRNEKQTKPADHGGCGPCDHNGSCDYGNADCAG